MTMTISEPTATNGNGYGVNALAIQQPQSTRLAVIDEGEFANLLDTARFDHLWRIARLFAASHMVPAHFQNKPEDCFVACQMAIRLGVDPFMFMQNTYVTQGKPGMEGKLAIALINTSGLFSSPIRFRYSGTGDGYGCEAYANLKSTGEEVVGPRVTIAIAKSEGWYARNQKWKSVPDLMLMYRSGSWFGRSVCPERLMGMQTVDELRDLEDGRIHNGGAQTKQARLNARIAPHPTAEDRVIDTTPEANTVDEDQSDAGSDLDAQTTHTEPEPPESEPQTPARPGPAASWAATYEHLGEIAMDRAIPPSELAKQVDGFCLRFKCKGAPEKLTEAQRRELIELVGKAKD